MSFRIENKQYNNPHKAILAIIAELIQHPEMQAYLRVPDEDAANNIRFIIEEAVDRIKIEFDGKEYGANPLWTPGKLKKDNGKIDLTGAFDQILHTKGVVGRNG